MAAPGLNLTGARQLGHALFGGGEAPAAMAEAQGESLGANTERAIAEANAQYAKNKALADPDLETKLGALTGGGPAVGTALAALLRSGGKADPEGVFKAIGTNQDTSENVTIADPNAPEPARVAAAQARNPSGLANPLMDANQQLALARANQANATATRAPAQNALDAAHAGYYDRSPGAGMSGVNAVGNFSPQLQEAISKGFVDPTKINSRNWRVYEQVAQNDPGLDFNAAHAGAAMQANPTFRQRAAAVAGLPENINNMVTLGTKLNYPDAKFAGQAKQWLMGQSNDPDLTQYMTVRNDTLLNLASVMRGVGMSDQAHTAEIEAAQPTMTPAALQAWAKGQLAVISTRQRQYETLQHPNIHPGAPAAAPAAPGAPAAPSAAPGAAPPSLQDAAMAELRRRGLVQ